MHGVNPKPTKHSLGAVYILYSVVAEVGIGWGYLISNAELLSGNPTVFKFGREELITWKVEAVSSMNWVGPCWGKGWWVLMRKQ